MDRNKIKEAIKFIRREERLIYYEWNHYKTFLFAIMIILALIAYAMGYLQNFLTVLGEYGYLGSLVSGFFSVYMLTAPFSIATFLSLSKSLNIWILTTFGALGGTMGDYLIYYFVRKGAGKSIKISMGKSVKLPEIKSKFVKKISPLMAIIIFVSLPDELIGILFGLEKYKLKYFLILSFIFNFIGILFLIWLGRIINLFMLFKNNP